MTRWQLRLAKRGRSALISSWARSPNVPHDYAEAAKWYRKAAESGLVSAQHNLATLYAEGLGVTQDYVQAYMWLSIFESADHETAVGSPYIAGNVTSTQQIAEYMTPAEVSKAERLAREWLANRSE